MQHIPTVAMSRPLIYVPPLYCKNAWADFYSWCFIYCSTRWVEMFIFPSFREKWNPIALSTANPACVLQGGVEISFREAQFDCPVDSAAAPLPDALHGRTRLHQRHGGFCAHSCPGADQTRRFVTLDRISHFHKTHSAGIFRVNSSQTSNLQIYVCLMSSTV